MICSIAYDTLYNTVVVPAQQLKDIQQEIDTLKIKVTKKMNPKETRTYPDSSSGIYVDVKPGNMLWDPGATHLYLIDLGMSAFMKDGCAAGPLDLPVVTAFYRPPELWAYRVADALC